MYRKKVDVDVISDVLKAVLEASPASTFVLSLMRQYEERGGLSKKQLQGLFAKAQKVSSIPPGKLATLEAEILKRPTRYKSEMPAPKPLFEKDEMVGKLIQQILDKYPQHKRVLFFRAKYDNNQKLDVIEWTELQKFAKILG